MAFDKNEVHMAVSTIVEEMNEAFESILDRMESALDEASEPEDVEFLMSGYASIGQLVSEYSMKLMAAGTSASRVHNDLLAFQTQMKEFEDSVLRSIEALPLTDTVDSRG